MSNVCKFPGCNKPSYKTWALVPLCKEHYGGIVEETKHFYSNQASQKIYDDERFIFHSIKHHIPWARKR